MREPRAVTARAKAPWPRAGPPDSAAPLSHSTMPGAPCAAAAARIAAAAAVPVSASAARQADSSRVQSSSTSNTVTAPPPASFTSVASTW